MLISSTLVCLKKRFVLVDLSRKYSTIKNIALDLCDKNVTWVIKRAQQKTTLKVIQTMRMELNDKVSANKRTKLKQTSRREIACERKTKKHIYL